MWFLNHQIPSKGESVVGCLGDNIDNSVEEAMP